MHQVPMSVQVLTVTPETNVTITRSLLSLQTNMPGSDTCGLLSIAKCIKFPWTLT